MTFSMPGVLTPFLLAFAISLALVPLCRVFATKTGLVSHPTEERWHRRPTALLGGVAVSLTVIGCAVGVGDARSIPVLLSCGVVIFFVGLTDDLVSLKPSTKLVAEIILASVFLFFGYRLDWVESLTIDRLLTVLWVVGITNAFNLLDNMDGLCGGIALIAGSAFLVNLLPVAPGTAAVFETRYLALLLGATAGFLVYNFHPASIFLGDSGSLFIGMSFAALGLGSVHETAGRSNLLSIVAVPVLVLLIPILDTTLVAVSRIMSGRSASAGGRDHSSHRLVAIGLSERAAVAVLWGLAAMGGMIAVAVRHLSTDWSGLLAAVFLLAMTIFAVYLARVRVYEEGETSALRESHVTPIIVNFVYKRRVAEVLLDMCLVSISYYAAYRLRFEGNYQFSLNFDNFLTSLPIVLGTQMAALFGVGAYRGVWRYFGLMDSVTFAKGVALGVVGAQLIILYQYRFAGYSRAVFVVHAALLFLIMTASRVSFRLISEFVARQRQTGRRLVVYGAGDRGSLVVRELLNDRVPSSYRLLGFIDDDLKKHRLRVHGYPVLGGIEELAAIIQAGDVDAIIVSTDLIESGRMKRLEELCATEDVALSRLHFDLQRLVSRSEGPHPLEAGHRESHRAGP